MVMNGMGMMMKSLGINPEEITQGVEQFKALVLDSLKKVSDNQQAVIDGQNMLLAGQQQIINLLTANRDCNAVALYEGNDGEYITKVFPNLNAALEKTDA